MSVKCRRSDPPARTLPVVPGPRRASAGSTAAASSAAQGWPRPQRRAWLRLARPDRPGPKSWSPICGTWRTALPAGLFAGLWDDLSPPGQQGLVTQQPPLTGLTRLSERPWWCGSGSLCTHGEGLWTELFGAPSPSPVSNDLAAAELPLLDPRLGPAVTHYKYVLVHKKQSSFLPRHPLDSSNYFSQRCSPPLANFHPGRALGRLPVLLHVPSSWASPSLWLRRLLGRVTGSHVDAEDVCSRLTVWRTWRSQRGNPGCCLQTWRPERRGSLWKHSGSGTGQTLQAALLASLEIRGSICPGQMVSCSALGPEQGFGISGFSLVGACKPLGMPPP